MSYSIMQNKTFFWLSLLAVLMVLISACSTPQAPITDVTWEWVSISETDPATSPMLPPADKYFLTLKADGTLEIIADCNGVGGTYILNDNDLKIELGVSTLMYCGDDSVDYIFTSMLGAVESYRIEDGYLYLQLTGMTGELVFSQK